MYKRFYGIGDSLKAQDGRLSNHYRCFDMNYDLIIKNGTVVDGTGNLWFKADVAIENGKIARVGRSLRGENIADAKGMIACPGFIDPHTHTDLVLLCSEPERTSLFRGIIKQGITTEVIGNCGFSAAPTKADTKELLQRQLGFLSPPEELSWDWSTFGEYLNLLENKRLPVNIVPLVGQGTVKVAVMGYEDRSPSEDELKEMKTLVAEAMKNGAVGLSTGLVYSPGMITSTQEVVELCKIVARYNGVYVSHIRGFDYNLVNSTNEAIAIGRDSGIPVNISHFGVYGTQFWGMAKYALHIIDEAREIGVDVAFDLIPYTTGNTLIASLFPTWAQEGGVEKLVNRLKDPAIRERIEREMETVVPGWPPVWPVNFVKLIGWEGIFLASCMTQENKPLEGKNFTEIGMMKGKAPFDALCDLVIEERAKAWITVYVWREDDVRAMLKHPACSICTDALDVGSGKPHPAAYQTSPRVLDYYVKKEKVLSLEEAIRKMTSLPAQRYKLRDRGLIAEGFWADIVIFDPKTMIDYSSYDEPRQCARGIEYVLLNGEIVAAKGQVEKEVLCGKVLRRTEAGVE